MLNNNFSYTQLSLAFVPQKDSYYVHDDTDASFLFLLQKDFYIAHEHIGTFCLFLFRKILGAFMCFFLKLFFVFYNSYLSFLYIEKNILSAFLFLIFFIRIFFIRVCSIRIRKNFNIVNNILRNLFFFNSIFTFF